MKPFLSGRPTHDHQPALARDDAAGSGLLRLHEAHSVAANRAGGPASGPTVECVKQGDKVVRLIITCSCGERIEVDCLYPGAA